MNKKKCQRLLDTYVTGYFIDLLKYILIYYIHSENQKRKGKVNEVKESDICGHCGIHEFFKDYDLQIF